MVCAFRHPCSTRRRLRRGPSRRQAEKVDRRLAWAHHMGPHHAGDLLSSHLERRRYSRRCIPHRDECARQRRKRGRVDGTNSGSGGGAQSVARDGPLLFDRAIVAGRDGRERPGRLAGRAIAAVRAALTGNPQQAQDARERAAQAVARAQSIPVDQARTQVQQYEQQYRQTVEQAKQQAAQAAETAAKAVSRGALFGALGLLLGAVAGWFGGRMGAVEPTLTPRIMR